MMKNCWLGCVIVVGLLGTAECGHAQESERVDFVGVIQPLLESACLSCHNEDNAEGLLQLETRELLMAGGDNGPVVVPGSPQSSSLYTTTCVPDDSDQLMPPEGARLSEWQTEQLSRWIEQGATWPDSVTLAVRPRVDFVRNIKPILEQRCLSCHADDKIDGGLDLSTQQLAFQGGDQGEAIVPFDADLSLLYSLTDLEADDDQLMPPKDSGGPLAVEQISLLESWIAQGANWPTGIELTARSRIVLQRPTSDNRELLEQIHARIVATAEAEALFANYQGEVPVTAVPFEMIAIPAGRFLMGSPSEEAERNEDEGPQREVEVDAFWIGMHEVTWDEYEPYMITQVDRHKWGARVDYDPDMHEIYDAVSQPTSPYTEMSFGMGQRGYPAISMTQHAASKYCQWLSAQTGHFYRLATEAEWEYACRAGSATAYSFGDDPAELGNYAWFYDNSNDKYQRVGQKLPNAWGIHDMHGNVVEWCIDQYRADFLESIDDGTLNPLARPTELYPRSVRGGSWYDDPEDLRSAVRRGSDESWKQQDPQLPKSLWYHTNAKWLGFRIVRPRAIPTIEELDFYWNSASDF